MAVQLNLKLRTTDRSALLLRKHEDSKSLKREHIREILIQNFLRHYCQPGTPIEGPEFIACEKMISDETIQFLKENSHGVNSKELAKFQAALAQKLKWVRAPCKSDSKQRQSLKALNSYQ